MRIRYLSDLHLEFIKPNKILNFVQKIKPNLDEICILAGDIGNPYKQNYDIFMNHVNRSFKKTFVIAGNHEYYRNTIDETQTHMHNYFQQFENISFLNNSFEIYENYCFIGTTLWSKITKPSYEINDVHCIANFNYLKYNRLNMLAVDFLEDAINNTDHHAIIITHHLPSHDLTDVKYKTPQMLPYNQWFSCDMDSFIENNQHKIKAWFYGHTHTPAYNTIHGIPFCCNPIGYPNENPKVDFEKYLELSPN